MKNLQIFALGLALLVAAGCKTPKLLLRSDDAQVSYAIGQSIGKDLKAQDLGVSSGKIAAGIKDAMAGQSALSDEEIKKVLTAFQMKQMAKQEAKFKSEGEKNAKEGEAFLADNAKKPGVVALASGLQYKVLKSGVGRSPRLTDVVLAHYVGTLLNGKEFDSSYKRKAPATFPVRGVIPGWTEALQKMKVGDKWQLFIPSKLAYGERGAGGVIGPNQTLIFEVELLGIK